MTKKIKKKGSHFIKFRVTFIEKKKQNKTERQKAYNIKRAQRKIKEQTTKKRD